MYVIVKNETGNYVSKPGSHNSYTNSLEYAQKFSTKEEADKNCCGNEYSVNIYDIIKAW